MGKVHGSLARAGKVKGQTAKKEKENKRKPKTGRAGRRKKIARRQWIESQKNPSTLNSQRLQSEMTERKDKGLKDLW